MRFIVFLLTLFVSAAAAELATNQPTAGTTDARGFYEQGLAKLKRGDCTNAIADFNSALRLDPRLANAYVGRAQAKLELQDRHRTHAGMHDAISDLNAAIVLDPGNAPAYYTRALYEQDPIAAAIDCNHAIKLAPGDCRPYFLRGGINYRSKKYQAALDDCNKAISLNSDFSEAYLLRGLVKRSLRQPGADEDTAKGNALAK